jgi:hypothetical protein
VEPSKEISFPPPPLLINLSSSSPSLFIFTTKHQQPPTRQRSRPTAQSTRKHTLNFVENFPRCTPPSLSCKCPLWDAAFLLVHFVDECDRGGGQRSAVPQFQRPSSNQDLCQIPFLDKSLPLPGLIAALGPRPTSTSLPIVALLDNQKILPPSRQTPRL